MSWGGAVEACMVGTIYILLYGLLVMEQVWGQLPTQPSYVIDGCYNSSAKYSENSPYQSNLNLVFSDLTSNASAGLSFYASSRDGVYALYYCRADIPSQLCADCVKAATLNATVPGGDCSNLQEGVIWYRECSLQYSSKSRVGLLEESPKSRVVSHDNVSDATKFGQVVSSNMNNLTEMAAYGNTSWPGFATGKEEVATLSLTLYSLVQCRPDINGSLCESCLQSAFRYLNSCCYSALRVSVFYPSCQLRYALTPFYYTHAPPPPLTTTTGKGASNNVTRVAIPVAVGLLLLVLIGCGAYFFWLKRKNAISIPKNNRDNIAQNLGPTVEEHQIGSVECYDLKVMESATANFSDVNKLGQGGFGSVYKGMLPNGKFVAVKRLSRTSGGDHTSEFKTEVVVVAKLQHRNLVRLLGYCVDREERILVYEFLPNLSLDHFLFDPTKSMNLNWSTRFKIIEGIAWGLRYLHVDSLLTIVHRDLKSSNILLDKEMNPKIADFGLAKLVAVDATTVNVTTIAGTMGYMPPEYLMTGRCTVKSDIYSFGVIILEIISGKSIGKFYDSISGAGLLYYAWKLWNERAIEGLIDPTLQNKYSRMEVERFAQIGLLCVQDDEDKRPTIRALLSMLENPSIELLNPSPSTFYRNSHPEAAVTTTVSQAEQTESELSTNNLYRHGVYAR